MKKDAIKPMPADFERYINKTDDVTVSEAIAISLQELDAIPLEQWNAIADRIYIQSPVRWTVKEIIQRIIDNERVFTYRALAFARGDKGQMPLYDEDGYANRVNNTNRTLEDLVAELKSVRRSFQALFESFSPQMLLSSGRVYTSEYSVLSIGFMIPGRQRWYFDVITERCLPLAG